VIYAVSRDKEVRRVQLVGSPDETRQAPLPNGPVSTAAVGEEELAEYIRLLTSSRFAMGSSWPVTIVGGTEAVIPSDGALQNAGVAPIWE
jgi:hypothetical protein